MKDTILLPGLNEQLNCLLKADGLENKSILVIGTATAALITELLGLKVKRVDIILDDENLVMIERMRLPKASNCRIRFMDYTKTDFADSIFDIAYAQGTIARSKRVSILNEINRVLVPGGEFCLGDMVYLKPDPPESIVSVWDDAGVMPLKMQEVDGLFADTGFEIISTHDLSSTLSLLYARYQKILHDEAKILSDEELQLARHDIIRMKHESNMYLKMGGDKYTGFFVYMLRKK